MKQLNFGSTNGVPNDPQKTVVHCPTQELAQKVLRIADSDWHFFRWDMYKEDTCIHFGVGYHTKSFYEEIGYTILPAEEFIRLNTEVEMYGEYAFIEGDKVFVWPYKWGVVKHKRPNQSIVEFKSIGGRTVENNTVSFTPYTIQGFSQERPKPDIREGQLIYVRTNEKGEWLMRYFSHFEGDAIRHFRGQLKFGGTATAVEYSLTNPLEEK